MQDQLDLINLVASLEHHGFTLAPLGHLAPLGSFQSLAFL